MFMDPLEWRERWRRTRSTAAERRRKSEKSLGYNQRRCAGKSVVGQVSSNNDTARFVHEKHVREDCFRLLLHQGSIENVNYHSFIADLSNWIVIETIVDDFYERCWIWWAKRALSGATISSDWMAALPLHREWDLSIASMTLKEKTVSKWTRKICEKKKIKKKNKWKLTIFEKKHFWKKKLKFLKKIIWKKRKLKIYEKNFGKKIGKKRKLNIYEKKNLEKKIKISEKKNLEKKIKEN